MAATCHLFKTRIRRNIRLAEAPSFGQSIFAYAPQSPGAEDYRALGGEVLASTPGSWRLTRLRRGVNRPARALLRRLRSAANSRLWVNAR